jgi:cell division protein FtsZ
VERAALAAIAAAVGPESMQLAPQAPVQPASYGDVTVRPIAQKPSLFPDQDAMRVEAHDSMPQETFIPQAAERPPLRAPRMPKFEELPVPAQNEIRQARGETEEEHPQKARMSLLQRLANVGLGRRDEETEPPIAARASGPSMAPMPPLPERKPQRSVAQQIAATDPVSEYARRPAPQGLDVHGRPAPVSPAPQGDDHLDIPAFLRRQAT